MNRTLLPALAVWLVWPAALNAQTTYSQAAAAGTFVNSSQPASNYGTLGGMEIAAPTTAQDRTEITLQEFNTAAMQASFNADYGAGNWTVTSVTLSLFSNVPLAGEQPNNSVFNVIAAGGFEFDLLGNNNWSETAITWNTLPTLLPGGGAGNTETSLGDFTWDAAGETSSIWTLGTVQPLVDEIEAGSEVTIMGQPTDSSTVGYLFNQIKAGAPGILNVTVQAVPEPSPAALLAGFVGVVVGLRCWRGKWNLTTKHTKHTKGEG